MGKLILCSIAFALGIQAQVQVPSVVGVTNDLHSSPTINPGSIGYVLGSGFGTVDNTVVTIAGLNARVLDMSNNQIRVAFPPNLPTGVRSLSVRVDGEASETLDVIVSERPPKEKMTGKGSVAAGPALRYSPPHSSETPIAPPRPDLSTAASTGGSGIVYTCDPTITAVSSTACNTLNTTIAALYRSAFSNANASIYITMGSTGAGMSNYYYNSYTYSEFRNALIASASDATDATAVASLPSSNPLTGTSVGITDALQRALGLSSGSCLPSNSCYDGTITISNSIPLYFRTGEIVGDQYDFFTIAEHETDEILGTASCSIACGSGTAFPADYFRYHSNGTRSFAAGTNDACTSSDATNACFSLNGSSMLQHYNNLNNGDDAGDWDTNCAAPLVQDAEICAGTGGVDISPAAEILVLDTVGFTTVNPSLQFYPVAPCRLVDTRGEAAGFNGIAPFSGPSIAAGATLTIPVQSTTEASTNTTPAPCGTIPSTAQAYSLNITLVPHAGAVDFVSLWPAGSPKPYVSTLDDTEGLIVANAAIVPGGTPSGGISVYNSGPSAADVVIDMNGYFAPPASGLQFYPVAPCRLVDTRGTAAGFNGIDPFAGPSITAGQTLTIPVQSTAEAGDDTEPAPCGVIPSSAQAYSFNLTVVPHAGGVDYVTLWPAGSTKPYVSTLDDPEGSILANAAIVPAGTSSGGVSVYNSGPATTDVVIDMNGYFAPPTTALQFYPVAPCRLVDTRGAAAGFNGLAPFSGPSISAGGTITIPVQSTTEASANTEPAPCGVIPSTAQAYSFNLTVVPHSSEAVDYVTLWPAGATKPYVSTLDDPESLIVSNAAIVPAGTPTGGISVYNAGPGATDVIIDMNGYFAP